MTAYYATRGFVLHKSRKDRKSRVVQTELQDCATKSRNREVDSKIVRRLHTLDGALAYTGRHVEGIRRSAEAIGPYRGVGISGCGRYVGRRVPCFGTPAHPRAGGFRFGYADSVGAYARVGFPGIVDGFTTMPPRDIASFLPQDGFEPPEGPFYLVVEPHTGTCYINREPDVARKLIDSDERLPLTLEEGLAIATQHPEWLLEKNGFNLLGSRSADGRVPSIWMSQNAPRLGAVWPNSRHTWLGNAFCVSRRGVSLFH